MLWSIRQRQLPRKRCLHDVIGEDIVHIDRMHHWLDAFGRNRLKLLDIADDAPNQRRRLYSTSLRSAQFSLDGKTVVTVNDYDQMGLPIFDVWRLPAP